MKKPTRGNNPYCLGRNAYAHPTPNTFVKQRVSVAIVALLLVALLATLAVHPPLSLVDPDEPAETTVTIVADNGTELANVTVDVAETRDQRRVGLSRTDDLEPGSGMLFVHSEPDTLNYHMRNMSFGIDIVFIAANGTITTIHEAPHPDDGGTGPYPGTGQYVLEVPLGWMSDQCTTVGDSVEIPPEYRDS